MNGGYRVFCDLHGEIFKMKCQKSILTLHVINRILVPKAGIEPARPKAHDFESCASTNSATQARLPDPYYKRDANMCNL